MDGFCWENLWLSTIEYQDVLHFSRPTSLGIALVLGVYSTAYWNGWLSEFSVQCHCWCRSASSNAMSQRAIDSVDVAA